MNQWMAIIRQEGTNDPIATVLRNEFGAPAIITRYAQGDYRIEFPDGFDISKLHLIVSPTWEADELVGARLSYSGGNVLQLTTAQNGSPGDDLMFGGIHILLTKGV